MTKLTILHDWIRSLVPWPSHHAKWNLATEITREVTVGALPVENWAAFRQAYSTAL